jgi:hypothetical protein
VTDSSSAAMLHIDLVASSNEMHAFAFQLTHENSHTNPHQEASHLVAPTRSSRIFWLDPSYRLVAILACMLPVHLLRCVPQKGSAHPCIDANVLNIFSAK